MPLTVAQQFVVFGWWVIAALIIVCAWMVYLKVRGYFNKIWCLRVLDLLLVLVLFSYILAVRVYL